MTRTLSTHVIAYVACVTLWPLSLLSAAPDSEANLSACKGGWSSCDRAQLTPPELSESLRNYTACRDGRGYCERSRLTPAQAAAIPEQPGVASSVGSAP